MHCPWIISSLPVNHILTTCEGMQYPWVISSVPVSHILSTCEDVQYPWVNLYEWRMNETSLTGTAYPHRYCIPSRVLRIWLMGTAYPHWHWGYDSRVLRIWLTGTAYPHGYWGYDLRVLRIWLTGTEDMTHGYWGYDSRVMHILTGTAYSLYRVLRWLRSTLNLINNLVPTMSLIPKRCFLSAGQKKISFGSLGYPVLPWQRVCHWALEIFWSYRSICFLIRKF